MCPLPQRSDSQTLTAADYVRLNKELAARERYVQECEKALDDADKRIKVLDKTIEAREKQLESVKLESLEAEAHIKSVQENHKKILKSLDTDIEYKSSELRSITEQVSGLKRDIDSLQTESRSIQKEITERGKYLKDQEKLITEAMEEGNVRLRQLQLQIQDLEEFKEKMQNSIYEVEQQRQLALRDLELATNKVLRAEADHSQSIETHQEVITTLTKKVKQANETLANIEEETNKKLAQLRIKEESIIAKQNALRKEQAELETDKRRFESTRNLYEL